MKRTRSWLFVAIWVMMAVAWVFIALGQWELHKLHEARRLPIPCTQGMILAGCGVTFDIRNNHRDPTY